MWWKGVFLNHLFFFLPASSLYAKLMLIASWLQLHGQRAETWKCCWSSHLTLGKKKRASQFFYFFFYQTISSKQEDFITMSTQQWLACCPCKHTVEHTPAAGERWRRTELWGRGQGKPSKSDLLYLHPGSLSLNISVRVCTRNRGGGGWERWGSRRHVEVQRWKEPWQTVSGDDSGVDSDSLLAQLMCGWPAGCSCRGNFAYSWAVISPELVPAVSCNVCITVSLA